MMDMMRACWQWMMSLGLIGAALGIVLFVGVVALLILMIVRMTRRNSP